MKLMIGTHSPLTIGLKGALQKYNAASEYNISFRGVPCDDHQTLAHYEIPAEATLSVSRRLRCCSLADDTLITFPMICCEFGHRLDNITVVAEVE